MEFQANIHGASLKSDKHGRERSDHGESSPKKSMMTFGDPEDYKDMSMEERKALTQKMMGAHRAWASGAPLS